MTVRNIWPVLTFPWVLFGALTLLAFNRLRNHRIFESLEVRTSPLEPGSSFRDLVELDVETTDLRDFVVRLLVWVGALGALYVVAAAFTTTAVVVEAVEGDGKQRRIGRTLRLSLLRTPKMVLTYVYCYLLPLLVVAAAVTAVVLGGAGLPAALLTGVLGALALVHWSVANSLTGVAVASRRGLFSPIRDARRSVRGHWWAVLARLVLLLFFGMLVGSVLGGVGQLGSVLGPEGGVAFAVIARMLTTLVSTTFSSSVQLEMLEALQAQTRTDTAGEVGA